jgi:hypothetical protein
MSSILPIAFVVLFFAAAIALMVLKKPLINLSIGLLFFIYMIVRYFVTTHDSFEIIMAGFALATIVKSFMDIQKQKAVSQPQ